MLESCACTRCFSPSHLNASVLSPERVTGHGSSSSRCPGTEAQVQCQMGLQAPQMPPSLKRIGLDKTYLMSDRQSSVDLTVGLHGSKSVKGTEGNAVKDLLCVPFWLWGDMGKEVFTTVTGVGSYIFLLTLNPTFHFGPLPTALSFVQDRVVIPWEWIYFNIQKLNQETE